MLGLCLVEAQSQEAAERKGIGGAPRDPEGSPVKWTILRPRVFLDT